MSFTEKIDVLDLLINILKEHEQKLDQIVTRLGEASELLKPAPVAPTKREPVEGRGLLNPVPSTEPRIILVRTENESLIVEQLIREVYATAPRIMDSTGIPEASMYYSLKQLRKRGVVKSAGSVSNKTGGPRTNIWTLRSE